jgi:hypothetical protein
MAKSLNAQTVASTWAQNLGAATQAYTSGVQSVSVSPGQSALQNSQAYLDGVMASYNNGTYAKGLQSFTLAEWQSAATTKGAPRLASGASSAKSKVQSFFQQYIPALQNIQSQVQSMPSNTFEARVQRSVAFQTQLHNLKGTLKQ